MIVKETCNRNDIESILKHPAIYETISGDTCPSADEFEAPINENYKYIGGYVKGKIVAIMVYHSYRDGNICHVQVLPEYRSGYAKKFGEESLKFRGNQQLYAEIPSLYKNVLEFAKLFGFQVIGINICDYVKHGVKYDTYILRFSQWDLYEI